MGQLNQDAGIARWCMQCVCDYFSVVLIHDVALRVSPHVCLSLLYMRGRLVQLLVYSVCLFVFQGFLCSSIFAPTIPEKKSGDAGLDQV